MEERLVKLRIDSAVGPISGSDRRSDAPAAHGALFNAKRIVFPDERRAR